VTRTYGGGDVLPVRAELIRKGIHLATAAVPALVWVLPRPAGIALLASGVAAALFVEWARGKSRWARYHFLSRTRRILRQHERTGFSGATYMVIAYLAALLILPKTLAVLAMLYNALGDSSAAVVGKRWGRHRTSWGKSWEGAAACFVVCLLLGLLLPGIPWPAALLGAAAASTLEFLPIPMDDNLRVTLGGGLAAWVGTVLASGLL
jgi:dolichol kinase